MKEAKMRWIDIVIEAANNLGGDIIYKNKMHEPEVKKIAEREGKNYTSKTYYTIANAIECHSSDSANFNGKDIFERVSSGHWRLRKQYIRKPAILNSGEYILQEDTQETEIKRLIDSRIGQSKFRKDLINLWQGCSVTKVKNTDLLIASHIKPWAVSDDRERLDVYNGLLLTPNLDKLFELGYISFSLDTGDIFISELINQSEYATLGIHPGMKIDIKNENKGYMQYHNDTIYKG